MLGRKANWVDEADLAEEGDIYSEVIVVLHDGGTKVYVCAG